MLIVLGVRRRATSTALLELAQSLHAVIAVCKRAEEEEEEAEKLPFSQLTGRRIRMDDWRGCRKEKGSVVEDPGSVVKMGRTRRPQAEPEEVSGEETVEAAVPPPTPGKRGMRRAATSKEC